MNWERTIDDAKLLPTATLSFENKSQYTEGDLNISEAITHAIKHGYKHIDCAQWYNVEKLLLQAIKNADKKREDIFISSKLIANLNTIANKDEASLKFIENTIHNSCKLLGGYIDLFMLHAPTTKNGGLDCLTVYKLLVNKFQKKGLIRSIGVSNFNISHLKCLQLADMPKPSVNQIECHPFLVPSDLINYCKNNNIQIEAYCPLVRRQKFNDPLIVKLSEKYNKTPAQILLRWGIQQGFVIIPKSGNKGRIEQNGDVFDFELSDDDMNQMKTLQKENLRVSWDVINTAQWDESHFIKGNKIQSKL